MHERYGIPIHWNKHESLQPLRLGTAGRWPVEKVHPGDEAWFEPNEKHRQGATAINGMTHIAIQESLNGKVVGWMVKRK